MFLKHVYHPPPNTSQLAKWRDHSDQVQVIGYMVNVTLIFDPVTSKSMT
jgi:hypothetical protein